MKHVKNNRTEKNVRLMSLCVGVSLDYCSNSLLVDKFDLTIFKLLVHEEGAVSILQ